MLNSAAPLTVCIFSNLYPPVVSGSSIYCSQLAIELAQRGCRVIVITSRVDVKSPEFELVDGVSIYRIPALKLPRMPIALNFPWLNVTFSPANTSRIMQILIKHSPHVIHLHNHMFDFAFHAAIMSRRLKIPLAITIHTIIKHMNPFHDIVLRLIDRLFLNPLVIKQADLLICPDQIMSKHVGQTFGAAKAILIPYGLKPPPAPDPLNMLTLREKYHIGDGPVILSIGHLHETRNRRELISILPQLVERFPNIKIMIVGYVGTDSANLLATQLGVQDHLILTGTVPNSQIPDFLGIGDIEAHWFDERHPHKTLGIAAQEAMAAGKAVIGNADENVYGEGVLRNGENVILIDPNDATTLLQKITEILMDGGKRTLIGNNARQTSGEHFSWDAVCDQTIAAYHSILNT